MADETKKPSPLPPPKESPGGPIAVVWLGLKVLAYELKWLVMKGIRGLELKQLERRLEAEYAALGKAVAAGVADRNPKEPMPEPDHDMELALKQIDFLKEEIDHLIAEREKTAEEYQARRDKLFGPKNR